MSPTSLERMPDSPMHDSNRTKVQHPRSSSLLVVSQNDFPYKQVSLWVQSSLQTKCTTDWQGRRAVSTTALAIEPGCRQQLCTALVCEGSLR